MQWCLYSVMSSVLPSEQTHECMATYCALRPCVMARDMSATLFKAMPEHRNGLCVALAVLRVSLSTRGSTRRERPRETRDTMSSSSSASGRAPFRLSSPRALAKGLGFHQTTKEQTIGGVVVAQTDASRSSTMDALDHKIMEGHLFMRIHVRRRRYCVLRGRTLHVFDSKDEYASASKTKPAVAKKVITVVGVRDAAELDKAVRSSLLGLSTHASLANALVISTQKSKLVVVEAETQTEKQRWLHAMSCLNFASSASEKSFFLAMLEDSACFDAHVAVSLLHKYRDNEVATELIIDRLAEYAEHNIDDVEFYIQQIMHLVVNAEMTKTEKLVHLLLSICKAKAYVEHLGNCIHLALQLFWLLEAKIEDKDPRTYNLCAKLLMSIEAKVVNQHFEPPASIAGAGGSNSGAVSALLLAIPGMKERLQEMSRVRGENQESVLDAPAKVAATRPEEHSPTDMTPRPALKIDTSGDSFAVDADTTPVAAAVSASEDSTLSDLNVPVLSPDEMKHQRELMLQWMEKERQKRYKYFHQQRDFVKALADISEKMRLIDPPHERKKHLPAALDALSIPEMAYIPLGRVTDPFCRITRVLKDEGTVFSTHSRAPCLLCFEVIEDHVNAAGHRSSVSKAPSTPTSASPRARVLSSSSSVLDEEAEIAGFIKKFSINGTIISVDDHAVGGGGEASDDGESKPSPRSDALSEYHELERQLDIAIISADNGTERTDTPPPPAPLPLASLREDALRSAASSSPMKSSSSSLNDETSLIRRHSRSAYEFGLAKMLTEGGVFGESWKEKKVRSLRVSRPCTRRYHVLFV